MSAAIHEPEPGAPNRVQILTWILAGGFLLLGALMALHYVTRPPLSEYKGSVVQDLLPDKHRAAPSRRIVLLQCLRAVAPRSAQLVMPLVANGPQAMHSALPRVGH